MTTPETNKIYHGDSFSVISQWPDSFVDSTVTSVPYWLQREYLPSESKLKIFEMGREQTIAKYTEGLGDLFAQVLRITKPSGTLWLNIGDKVAGPDTRGRAPGYKDGELLGLPDLVKQELRKRGWLHICTVIWSKPNPLPGGWERKPDPAHEPVLLFSKTAKHFYDANAALELSTESGRTIRYKGIKDQKIPDGAVFTRKPRDVWDIPVGSVDGRKLICGGHHGKRPVIVKPECPIHGANPAVTAGPLFGGDEDLDCLCEEVKQDFYASMPLALAERCILLGTSELGNCSTCGAPWKRLVRKDKIVTRRPSRQDERRMVLTDRHRHLTSRVTIGWAASCKCPISAPVPAIVFDPFCGSGTTPAAASLLGRSYLACELDPVMALKAAPARIEQLLQRSA